jgi:cyclic-di-AMP phosphodiesterase
MPDFYNKRWHGSHVIALFILAIIFVGIMAFYQWVIALVGMSILILIFTFALKSEAYFREELGDYISTLSYRVRKVGEEALLEMPIGIVLYDDENKIEWTNPYINNIVHDEDTLIGNDLDVISEDLSVKIKDSIFESKIQIKEKHFRVTLKKEERLLYFFDITEQAEIEKSYKNEQPVIGIIYLDNYEEVTQGMEDEVRININSQVTNILKNWAKEHNVFLKRTSSERFIALFNQKTLKDLEKNKFSILDEVREATQKQNIKLTLSIGIGSEADSYPSIGNQAQSSLDLALGRGGDQVAIKNRAGKATFFGGKTGPAAKHSKVRARVISHGLRELILESDKVLIMGHVHPDMDSLGAAIGIIKVAEANGKNGFIVLDHDDIHVGIEKLINEVKKDESLWSRFIPSDEALEEATDETLLVVVDTNKPSMVVEPRLLKDIDQVVVIDHHRKGEDFIKDPVLVYMEPYASSTSELVTEMLYYQEKDVAMSMIEASALLAGIIVDTKSFTYRTGIRTFDAAAYLRGKNADTVLVQKILREDIHQYVQRGKLIEQAKIYSNGVAITKGQEHEIYDPVILAQAADTLLTLSDVEASFAISKTRENIVSISARSLGEMNVQVIMEQLNGGGHLTNAATQLEDLSVSEAEELLLHKIEEFFKGREEL